MAIKLKQAACSVRMCMMWPNVLSKTILYIWCITCLRHSYAEQITSVLLSPSFKCLVYQKHLPGKNVVLTQGHRHHCHLTDLKSSLLSSCTTAQFDQNLAWGYEQYNIFLSALVQYRKYISKPNMLLFVLLWFKVFRDFTLSEFYTESSEYRKTEYMVKTC